MSAFARPRRQEPQSEEELFEYAIGSLARRMRTEHELRRLMAMRVEPGSEGEAKMARVIQRLQSLKYLSDERYARDFVRLRRENQAHGRRRVQMDLAAKGVSKQLVAQAIGEAFDETDEVSEARRFAERKRIKPPGNEKETARALGRLLRAGFSSPAAFALLREWRVPVEEVDVDDGTGPPEE